jgi:hypothetical protein
MMKDPLQLLRMTVNCAGGGLKERLFFLHVPKCGGVSVQNAIESCYSLIDKFTGHRQLDHPATNSAAKALNPSVERFSEDDYEVLKFREQLLLYFMSQKSTRYVTGHFAFSETAYKAFGNKFTFLTILRDPVPRWISLYFFGKHRGSIREELKDFVDSDYARSQGYEFVKFIGGPLKDGNYTTREAIDRAKENLERIHIVGALEHQDDFCAKFKARLGVDLRIPEMNTSPVSRAQRESVVTEEIKERVREICRPDLEVYRYAVENFVKSGKMAG